MVITWYCIIVSMQSNVFMLNRKHYGKFLGLVIPKSYQLFCIGAFIFNLENHSDKNPTKKHQEHEGQPSVEWNVSTVCS